MSHCPSIIAVDLTGAVRSELSPSCTVWERRRLPRCTYRTGQTRCITVPVAVAIPALATIVDLTVAVVVLTVAANFGRRPALCGCAADNRAERAANRQARSGALTHACRTGLPGAETSSLFPLQSLSLPSQSSTLGMQEIPASTSTLSVRPESASALSVAASSSRAPTPESGTSASIAASSMGDEPASAQQQHREATSLRRLRRCPRPTFPSARSMWSPP